MCMLWVEGTESFVVELIKLDDLDKTVLSVMHRRLGCVRLGCHVVVLMLFLLSLQLKMQLIPGP